jgi:hypothetical protein
LIIHAPGACALGAIDLGQVRLHLTIFGSKEPSRSRGTVISTGPTSVRTVLERLPLRELPPFLPAGSCSS